MLITRGDAFRSVLWACGATLNLFANRASLKSIHE
jgi:hypothetical protein